MPDLDFGLKGKLAVVTGGANGIGFATARLLAAHGASVCLFDLERENPYDAARQIGADACSADVTNRESLDAAFRAAGTPDILIANAGTVSEADFCEYTPEEWDRIVSVNLSGAFHSMQSAARLMRQRRGGAIVVIASTNSYDGEARLAAYNASKAGLLGLVRTAANELGPFQIRVNAVCPGLIRTRLTEGYFANPEILRNYFRQIPLGRGGEPDQVAQASVFHGLPPAFVYHGCHDRRWRPHGFDVRHVERRHRRVPRRTRAPPLTAGHQVSKQLLEERTLRVGVAAILAESLAVREPRVSAALARPMFHGVQIIVRAVFEQHLTCWQCQPRPGLPHVLGGTTRAMPLFATEVAAL